MTTPPALRRNGEFRTGRGRRMEDEALVESSGVGMNCIYDRRRGE